MTDPAFLDLVDAETMRLDFSAAFAAFCRGYAEARSAAQRVTEDDDGDWQHARGPVVELAGGQAWLYNFETDPEPGFPDGGVFSLDRRDLRAFADLLDEVTP